MGVLVVLVLIAATAYYGFVQYQCRQEVGVKTSMGRIAVQEIIDRTFGSTWSRVQGRGDVNVKPKLRRHAPTISISVDAGSGATEVSIWMSAFVTRYLLVYHAQLVWRKKRELAAALAAESGPLGLRVPAVEGSPVQSSTSGSPVGERPLASMSGSQEAPVPKPAASKVTQQQRQGAGSADDDNPMIRTMTKSELNLILRSRLSPAEVVAALRDSIAGVQVGTPTHLLLGPPRATMWGHLAELRSGDTILALSLVTADDPDEEYVKEHVRGPIEDTVAPVLAATVTETTGSSLAPSLVSDLRGASLVEVTGLIS